MIEHQDRQKTQHDQQARERVIQVGDPVFAKSFRDGPTWVPAVVTAQTGPVSYNVELEESGSIWRRHVDQLRRRHGDSSGASMEKASEEETPIPVLSDSDGDSDVSGVISGPATTPSIPTSHQNPRKPPDRYQL